MIALLTNLAATFSIAQFYPAVMAYMDVTLSLALAVTLSVAPLAAPTIAHAASDFADITASFL